MRGLFITGTDTGVGKTWVSRGLAYGLRREGRALRAIKAVETGGGDDAARLARAAGEAARVAVATADAPLAPWAASLEGAELPSWEHLAARLGAEGDEGDVVLVEGAGGPLVPYDDAHDMVDLAVRLRLPAVLVARDGLGTISATRAAAEAVVVRGVELLGIALVRWGRDDGTRRRNGEILRQRLGTPVYLVDESQDEDDALAEVVVKSGLLAAVREALFFP